MRLLDLSSHIPMGFSRRRIAAVIAFGRIAEAFINGGSNYALTHTFHPISHSPTKCLWGEDQSYALHGLNKLLVPRLKTARFSTSTAPGTTQEDVSSANEEAAAGVGVVNGDYGADQITVLEGLEPVRLRPGMYIGSTGRRGLHHLIWEVVDNSVDEALAGHCDSVHVELNEDGSVTVSDNGRGIPCDIHPKTGRSALETVLTVLHAGGKFGGDDSGYKVSGGLHGVGISVVNALSRHLEVQVVRNGQLHCLQFSRGLAVGDLQVTPASEAPTGTRVNFHPDPEIFKTTTEFEWDRLQTRMDELAFLNAGVRMTLTDYRVHKAEPEVDEDGVAHVQQDSHEVPAGPRRKEFFHEGGLAEYLTMLCKGKTLLHPEVDIIRAVGERDGVAVEVVLRWSKDQYTDSITTFANGIRTGDGGSHLEGVKASLTRTINNVAKKTGRTKESISGEFIREGLSCVVSVKVPNPEFEGQTKNRLGNPEVRPIVDSIVAEELVQTFEWNPKVLGAIVDKAQAAAAAAAAAKAARDVVRRKSLLTSTVLPGKLADCASKSPEESEIFIVEGDSAAGSAKQGRDRQTQAILPLRGKILNIEKCASEKIYQNAELQALISALGLGIKGNEFDKSQLRYHRIIIMTDADVDGAHIRILLLTFLYRYQRALVDEGFVYIACPPLYKVSQGKFEEYLFDQQALDDLLPTLPETPSINVQRFKGLGEMMPGQLWDTTMDPEKRQLKLVTVEDAASADRMLTVLMGDAIAARKEFISLNADSLSKDDLDF